MVHLIANLRRIKADNCASACTRRARSETPCSKAACVFSNPATEAGSAVSSTVPSAKTALSSASVW